MDKRSEAEDVPSDNKSKIKGDRVKYAAIHLLIMAVPKDKKGRAKESYGSVAHFATWISNFLFFLRNQLIMRVGVEYLMENLDQLVNRNELPTTTGALRVIKMFNSAINSAYQPIFEQILGQPQLYQAFNLINRLDFKVRIMSNYAGNRTMPIQALITLIEEKFFQVKIIGAQDNEETDSLEYIAIFNDEKLMACSEAWDQRLHEVDKNMLYM